MNDQSGHKQKTLNGMLYRVIWETFTLSSPYGSTVIAVNMSRPVGKRKIFEKEGEPNELGQLIREADQAAEADSKR